MPPAWVQFPIAMAIGALSMAIVALTFRMQGVPLPVPQWWQRVPSLQRRLTYAAIVAEVVAASVLLWSIEPGHQMPEAVRVVRGLVSVAAVATIGWVAISVVRDGPRS